MNKKIIVIPLAVMFAFSMASVVAGGGFDEFGYNYNARIYVGTVDGVDRVLDGRVYGEPSIFANDHIIMKWSQAWDDALYHHAAPTPDAWCINEVNGMVPGGSGISEHAKIVWVGPELENSPYWREGGAAFPPFFEAIFDHYVGPSVDPNDSWLAKVIPSSFNFAG